MSLDAFTLIVPFYRNVAMLRAQLDVWEDYPDAIDIIVVDDGSPERAISIIESQASRALMQRLTLLRITTDIPWNRGGARNLGVQEARSEWIVHIDIDHVLPAKCAAALLKFDPRASRWYRFERYRRGQADETRNKDKLPRECAYGHIHPHIDSYLVTRRLFWQIGGYDEDYSGCLGGGSPFLKTLERVAGRPPLAPADVFLEVYTRSVVADASDHTLPRGSREYSQRRTKKEREGNTVPKNPIRFPWVRETFGYPIVAGEFETVEQLAAGASIARFGDGELKLLEGREYSREPRGNAQLTAELRAIVQDPAPCLLGVPTMDPAGVKYDSWTRHKSRFMKYFDGRQLLYSAFITRPDSAQWCESRAYYDAVTRIWQGKNPVAIVAEPTSKLLKHVASTNEVAHIPCPSHFAYDVIDELELAVMAVRPAIALLSCGITATCLAHRLARRGVQAIDLGSIGGFLLRWRDR